MKPSDFIKAEARRAESLFPDNVGVQNYVLAILKFLDEQAEKQECPECHYPKGVAHARKCSLRRDGLVGETEESSQSNQS